MPKVLISDKLSPKAVEIFETRGVEVDVKTGLEPAELAAIIGEYDGLAIRSATKVTGEILVTGSSLDISNCTFELDARRRARRRGLADETPMLTVGGGAVSGGKVFTHAVSGASVFTALTSMSTNKFDGPDRLQEFEPKVAGAQSQWTENKGLSS